jgi:hypothetical protein
MVWRALWRGSVVAVKIIPFQLHEDDGQLAAAEAVLSAKLDHPHVLTAQAYAHAIKRLVHALQRS